jgi:hypothetical protein
MSDENVFAKSVMAQMTDTPTSAPTEAATGDKVRNNQNYRNCSPTY